MLEVAPPRTVAGGWRLDTSYSRLPESLFEVVAPTPVARPELVIFNHALAAELGLDAELLTRPEQAGVFTGNIVPDGAVPIAQAYSGHQFGYFTTLGDGRAILLGEHLEAGGGRVDVQWKGTGPTRFSRRGDGRAALGPMLREYLISEAMHGLGIPTTRSLAVATTGEPVWRESRLPGAVLTRVAASHLRVGTFEEAARRPDPALLRTLADYTLERHYPELLDAGEPYLALLRAVVDRQAALIARWMLVGFVHGVMNTDNVSLAGETIDYGPCAFLEVYDPATVFSSIDEQGRYAYGRQPQIGQWNLARFAETLLPLLDADTEQAIVKATEVVETFAERFRHSWFSGMKAKLGFIHDEPEDEARLERLLQLMRERRSDFTNTFRALSQATLPHDDPAYREWFEDWQARIERQSLDRGEVLASMRRHNPAVIPRNHQVQEALDSAEWHADFAPFHRLKDALSDPYDHTRERSDYLQPAPQGTRPYRTFCGT